MKSGRPSEPAPASTASDNQRSRPLALSVGTWLALALGGVLGIFLIGNFMVRSSAERATADVVRVAQEFEPRARRARLLKDSIVGFDRAVLEYAQADAANNRAGIDTARQALEAAFAGHDEFAGAPEVAEGETLEKGIADHIEMGIKLADLRERRNAMLAKSRALLDGVRDRIGDAGARGLPQGENVFARRSLTELARALEDVRDTAADHADSRQGRVRKSGTEAIAVFRGTLRQHASEFERSPGLAWLELVRGDFDRAVDLRRNAQRVDGELDSARATFDAMSWTLTDLVRTRFEEPAWNALTAAASSSRLTLEEAGHKIAIVGMTVFMIVLLVAAAGVYGIILPVRRLTRGTRSLAGGVMDTRVRRGGARELDELAQSFNEMATGLAHAEQRLLAHQAELEERVARRTQQLRHLAHHDPLTALPNRRHLFAYLAVALKRASAARRSLALLFLDLDNFKTINDTLGHEFGDKVLRAVGTRLHAAAAGKGFTARLGGDEFTLVMELAGGSAEIEQRAARLVQDFQRPLQVGDRELSVGVSVGAAVFPEHAIEPTSLLRAADAALFRAKELGRNRANLYSPELLAAASSRFRTEQALRRAIETGDLLVLYQPQVSLQTKATSAVEALLRWRQPEGHMLAAAEFLAVAEQSGLIMELNHWVMRESAQAVAQWRNQGWHEARIAVNVSSRQFLAGDFVGNVERTLRQYEMSPQCLELELTETVLQTGAVTIETLRGLRSLGVSVALDDFGTGYSSLTSLQRLPLNRVKLDRSLVADVDFNPRAAAIVRSIVGLCRSLGLQVTAEGVERAAQLDFLTSCGDVHVQGYYIERPAVSTDIPQFVANSSARMEMLLGPGARDPVEELLEADDRTILPLRPRRR